jgi:hypothetical protein
LIHVDDISWIIFHNLIFHHFDEISGFFLHLLEVLLCCVSSSMMEQPHHFGEIFFVKVRASNLIQSLPLTDLEKQKTETLYPLSLFERLERLPDL